MACEQRCTLPMRMTCTMVVRAPYRATLERRTKRLRQQAKDLGAEVRLLRWEQGTGWLAAGPLRRPRTTTRGQPVETGTVARTYAFFGRHAGARGRCAVRCGGHISRYIHGGSAAARAARVGGTCAGIARLARQDLPVACSPEPRALCEWVAGVRDRPGRAAGECRSFLRVPWCPELGKRCQPPTAVTAARCDSRGVRNQRARRRQRASGSEQQPAQRLQSPLA